MSLTPRQEQAWARGTLCDDVPTCPECGEEACDCVRYCEICGDVFEYDRWGCPIDRAEMIFVTDLTKFHTPCEHVICHYECGAEHGQLA